MIFFSKFLNRIDKNLPILPEGVEAEDKLDVGEDVAGGVKVKVLLQPPLNSEYLKPF